MIWFSLRSLIRDVKRCGFYTFVNVFGLAIGMAVCLLVLLFMQRAFSYDAYHRDGDRIHQVLRYQVPLDGGEGYYSRGIKGSVGPSLVEDVSEVEETTRFINRPMWAGIRDRGFIARGMIADPNFFDFFTFPTVAGGTVSEVRPGAIYVTEDFAIKLFGSTDVVGRSIRINYKWLKGDFRIAEVLRSLPDVTSHILAFDFVVHRKAITAKWVDHSWTTGDHAYLFIHTFIRLVPGVTPEHLRIKLDAFARNHLGQNIAKREPYALLPLRRLHLYGHRDFKMLNAKIDTGDIYQCYAFALVGGFLLLIACINFINLSTARAEDRALEVGVRKAVGATRVQLAIQFLMETCVLAICSAGLAVVLVALTLPWINGLIVSKLELDAWSWILSIILAVFTGVIAGAYPAFLLSSFRPAFVLKRSRVVSAGRSYLRQGLVVSQFTIAVVLIVVTLAVDAQMQYVRTRDLGFRRDGLITLPFFVVKDPVLFDRYETIRARFLSLPGVVGYAASSYLPGRTNYGDRTSVIRSGQIDSVDVYQMSVDHNFTTVYGIPIAEGRGFRKADQGLNKYLLVNQTAARLLGGAKVGDVIEIGKQELQVIGVFEDFFYNSLYNPMAPLVLEFWFANYDYITLDIRTDNLQKTMASLASVWKDYIPNRPFEFQFIDERIASFYREEHRTQEAFVAMSVLTILVACLGLLGLIAHAVRVRTKEIGVRKVLGASIVQVAFLLIKDLIKLVILANVVAWPIAYFIARDWLDRFAYRIDLGIGFFVVGGSLALMIALMTVIYQTLKAARANPVDALRNE